MPVMDGYEATQKIREIYYEYEIPQPIILAVTGHCEK
jgi:CheY-like chemotaxis protein